MAIFHSYISLDLQLCLLERERRFKRLCPLCQLLDSHWKIGLLVLSLLKQITVCLVRESRYKLREKIDISSFNA